MLVNRTQYYLSSGEKNAMRTLRVCRSGPNFYSDEYICNLARDFDTAIEKAKSMIGTNPLFANFYELNGWGETPSNLKPWMKEQIAAINMGVMPFGKFKGETIADMEEGYIRYWVKQTASNVVGAMLVQKFIDLANERDLFTKWESEEAEKEAAKKAEIEKMCHVGKVGVRMEMFIRCDKVISIDGFYGVNYMNICKDRDGNQIIYKGSNRWDEGKYYRVEATVKKHDSYKDMPQTFINRPTIKKIVEKGE